MPGLFTIERKQINPIKEERRASGMGRDMRPPGRRPDGLFKFIFIAAFLLIGPTSLVRTQGKSNEIKVKINN